MLQMRLDRYRPILPETLYAPDFDMPNLIVLEDGDVRKGIDVCEGEVAWLSTEQKMEVLHLYEDEIPQIGIRFYPMPKLGAAYYKDTYDPSRYIDVANYVDVMEKDYITELRDVAYHLGAKSCRLEVSQKVSESEVAARKGGLKADVKKPGIPSAKAAISVEGEASSSMEASRDIRFSETFEGDAEPVRPQLVRLQHDREIEHLVNTRCSSARKNTLTHYSYEIRTSEIICLSEAQAAKLDAAVKGMGAASTSMALSSKVSREMHKKMLFVIEF